MGTLLIILGGLFVGLFIVIKVTEKHGKPLEPAQQSKLSRIFMVIVGVLLLARALDYFLSGA